VASVHPTPPSAGRGWRAILRQRAARLLLGGGLVGLLVVALAAGWVDWLVGHPRQAWVWVRQRWFAAPALSVFVTIVGVVVAVVMARWQQRSTEHLAAAERARQEQLEQERLARQRERDAAAEQATWARRCRELLALWPLPTIQEVNPFDIGVFYSRRAEHYRGQRLRPPYVPRAVDEKLAGLLRSRPLVLVKGQSRAGKSRTAFEVAARELPGWRLLVPKHRAALAGLGELDRLPGEGEQVLVWLDDLDQYVAVEGTGGLDAGLLTRLAACDPPMRVLATIRLEEHGRLATAPGELGRVVRELLNRFDPGAITLPVGFEEPAERAAITKLYPGEQVEGGLAEHLAAVHELVDRLEAGEASVPEGAGLVLAAVDWRRARLDRPVSRAELAELLPLYLKRLRPLLPVVREGEVDRGLGWATDAVGRTAALLVADPDPLADTFRVADPIVDLVERRTGRRLADPAVWERLLGMASPEQAVSVGFAAYTRGERRAAENGWRRVIDSGDPDQAPRAAVGLGTLLDEQRDVAGAWAAYQQAIDSRHPDAGPTAALNLGNLLAEQGWMVGARAAYQQAIDSGHRDMAPAALIGLGRLLDGRGDVAGARAAYQQAIDSGRPNVAPTAAYNLGILLARQGDVASARAAYQQAIDSGHPNLAAMAAVKLGAFLFGQGDVAGACAAFQQAMDSGHHDLAPKAAHTLGTLLAGQGDVAGARAAYRQAIDSRHPDAAPQAAVELGRLLAGQGDVAGARAAYQQAIDSRHPEATTRARQALDSLEQRDRQA
jgi:tetratricopeptide (TPR) repeat protein